MPPNSPGSPDEAITQGQTAPYSLETDADDIADTMIGRLLEMQTVRALDIHVPPGAIIPELNPGLWDMIKEDVGGHNRNLWPELLVRVANFCCFKVKQNATGDFAHANPAKPEIDKSLAMLVAEKLHFEMNCRERVLEMRESAKRREQEFLDSIQPRLDELNARIFEAMKRQ